MVDYSKWDNLDSDISDTESDTAEATQRQVRLGEQQLCRTQGQTNSTGAAADGRIVEAEALRCVMIQWNSSNWEYVPAVPLLPGPGSHANKLKVCILFLERKMRTNSKHGRTPDYFPVVKCRPSLDSVCERSHTECNDRPHLTSHSWSWVKRISTGPWGEGHLTITTR